MDSSSSRQTLFQLFEGIVEWRKELDLGREEDTVPWNESHLSIVYAFIIKLGNVNFNFKVLKKFTFGNVNSASQLSRDMVASFMQELHEFFIMPKLDQLSDENDLNKSELLAAFINFLLQLLHHKTDLIHPFEDQIDQVKKELRFLVTILGDTSLLGDEDLEEVKNLLAEFEEVANEAGRLVHSFIFAMDKVFIAIRMGNALAAMFTYIDSLRDNINNFSFLLQYITRANITPKTGPADSLFIVNSILHDLEDIMNREHNLRVDVMAQIKVLHQQLMLSQSFLKDIKVPRLSEIEELKGPVMRISDLAHEAEYLVNSFLIGDDPQGYLTIRIPDIIHKIKFVGTELEEIKKNYDIGASKVAKSFSAQQQSLQAKRNSEVDGITVGLEDETTHILDKLVGGTHNLQTISIFGMAGLGKTTFAKKLYNHPSVNYYFDKRSWGIVSQTYQRKNLLIDILISFGSELGKDKISNMEEESLAEHIYKSLKGRRYLIIMDDVWDLNAWNDLRRYFPDDGNGSRILFTSRNKDWTPPNSIIYELPPLSNDQCWELLEKKVFHNKPCPPQLLEIGKRIAENCHGMPLAVVVVAGILSSMDKEESNWINVGKNLGSCIFSDQNNSMMQILKLSYDHLPDHLKPCFLYFGAFPEDTAIHVTRLKCLWIAEGFIHNEERLKSSETVAEEYLMELICRSLVIVAKRRSDGGAKACVVHDLFRDLCLRIAEKENFLKWVDNNYSIYTKHHRLCVHMKPNPMASRESSLPFGLHVRSFFGYLEDSLFNFLNIKLLRVLDLPHYRLRDGDGIEFLVHLRYLGMKYTPASIGRLVNLEFLIVDAISTGPHSVSSLIQKLVKLRYLSSKSTIRIDKEWNSNQPNNLEFISNVYIDKLEDEERLKCSPLLREIKCICVPFVDEQGEYRYPNLSFLTQLESITMAALRSREIAEIKIPFSIKKLTLQSVWLDNEKMSTIGRLPNLQVLKLEYNAFVGEIWDTIDGEFQQLTFLKLINLGITQWNVASGEHFPRLQRLVLDRCYILHEIPCEIGEIATLQLIEVKSGRKSVAESAIKIEQEQREMGNGELRVIIRDTYQ